MKHTFDAILRPEQAAYLEALERSRDELLGKMERYAVDHRHPISDPEVASFLAITVASRRAERILELGTNIGYGAIVMARAAGPKARVLTVELYADVCDVARGFIEEAGLTDRITVRQGSALGVLGEIEPGIDLAYIDCVKEEYPAYLEKLVPLLAPQGVIVADNVLWKGYVAQEGGVPDNERARTEALRAFNLAITSNAELRAVVLPLGDGVAYAVKQ